MLKNRNIPFGYCVINGKYAINEIEAQAVREIFENYINGKSLKTIAAEMQIPYNSGKAAWNKNMVARVLENRKYIGENGYPRIIYNEEFNSAAQIKSERNTYRKPAPQAEQQAIVITETEYEPTEEIRSMTEQINRMLDSENADKNAVEALIIRCAQLKYSAIKELR